MAVDRSCKLRADKGLFRQSAPDLFEDVNGCVVISQEVERDKSTVLCPRLHPHVIRICKQGLNVGALGEQLLIAHIFQLTYLANDAALIVDTVQIVDNLRANGNEPMSGLAKSCPHFGNGRHEVNVHGSLEEDSLCVDYLVGLGYERHYLLALLVEVLQPEFLEFEVGFLFVGRVDVAFQVDDILTGNDVDVSERMPNLTHELRLSLVGIGCEP